MKRPQAGWALLALVVVMVSCSEPELVEEAKPTPNDENLTPAQLTGIPSLDQQTHLELTVLYAQGTGILTGQDRPLAPKDPIPAGNWLVSTPGSEFELSLRTPLITDGIVRLGPSAHFLLEQPNPGSSMEARFRLYTGQASFFVPPLPQNCVVVMTPSGTLTSPGGAFTVTVSPDFQVLVTCREGLVILQGSQSAAAWPGQVFQFGPRGTNRAWTLTPNQALAFQGRWLQVMTEEASTVIGQEVAERLTEFRNLSLHFDLDLAELSTLWWTSARTLRPAAPGQPGTAELARLWDQVARERRSRGPVLSAWENLPSGESLLGDRL